MLNGTIVEVQAEEVLEAMTKAYDGKMVNFDEQTPLKLRDDCLILKVTTLRFDPMKPSSLTYGHLVEDTVAKCIVAEKDKLKIKVTGGQGSKKELFKADFNF